MNNSIILFGILFELDYFSISLATLINSTYYKKAISLLDEKIKFHEGFLSTIPEERLLNSKEERELRLAKLKELRKLIKLEEAKKVTINIEMKED